MLDVESQWSSLSCTKPARCSEMDPTNILTNHSHNFEEMCLAILQSLHVR